VLPSGSKFEIVGTEGHLKEIIPSMEYADMQMARSINAMFMNIGGQRGMGSGRAQSESQTNFFALGLQAVADQIAMTIRNDVVRPLVAMNFGEDAPVPMVGAENVQARGLEQKAQIISQLAQQGAWVSDRGSINQDRHELGYPEFENTDLVLARGVTIQGVNDPVTVQSQMPQEQGTGHSGQGTEPGSQKSKGKSQNAKLAAEEVDGARLSVTGKNFRTFKSDYWPEPVHPSQAHIDFASIQQAMATGEDRIAAHHLELLHGAVRPDPRLQLDCSRQAHHLCNARILGLYTMDQERRHHSRADAKRSFRGCRTLDLRRRTFATASGYRYFRTTRKKIIPDAGRLFTGRAGRGRPSDRRDAPESV